MARRDKKGNVIITQAEMDKAGRKRGVKLSTFKWRGKDVLVTTVNPKRKK